MNLYQKLILIIGSAILLAVALATPMKEISIHNPDHKPYSKSTSAYVSSTAPDYGLIVLRMIGVAGVTGAAYVIAKDKEE